MPSQGNQRRGIRGSPLAAFQMMHPVREEGMLPLDQLHQFRRCPLILAQPQVERLLQFPGRFTQVIQADHAAAALQGMRIATDGSQRFQIVRIGLQNGFLLAHGIQHFPRFLEEDSEQLGIDFLVRRIRQLLGCGRGLQHFRFLRLERRQRRIDLVAAQIAGFQRLEGRLGALAKFMVGHQIGILLDGLQVLLEFLLQALVLRRLLEGLDQGLGITSLAG